jgi:hypothetical protein
MSYVDTDELFRVLNITNPSAEQVVAMQRVIDAATGEIDTWIDRPADADPLADEDLALAEQVCIQRACELWGLQEVPLGLAGIGSEFGSAHLARDSFLKYTYTLSRLKEQWGIA